jgi:hypothetical protein
VGKLIGLDVEVGTGHFSHVEISIAVWAQNHVSLSNSPPDSPDTTGGQTSGYFSLFWPKLLNDGDDGTTELSKLVWESPREISRNPEIDSHKTFTQEFP